MDAYTAKHILIALKKQIRQRNVFQALDVAIEALAWRELDTIKIIDVDNPEEEKGFEQQQEV